MGIRSTRRISRDLATRRILEVNLLISQRDYRGLENCSGEYDYNIKEFVDGTVVDEVTSSGLSKWTDTMIADKMDEPFFRFSMFDNYLIEDISL